MVLERPLCVALDGFTLHAATRAGGGDEQGREALLKYILRPAVAQERVTSGPEGLVRIGLKKAFAGAGPQIALTTLLDVLPRVQQRLDALELLILEDIGYVQQSAAEVEVLFTLMAERHERRSLLITSNLMVGEWDRMFKNPMTTAAAIDRLVYHLPSWSSRDQASELTRRCRDCDLQRPTRPAGIVDVDQPTPLVNAVRPRTVSLTHLD